MKPAVGERDGERERQQGERQKFDKPAHRGAAPLHAAIDSRSRSTQKRRATNV
jgi:hypothetical protein